jgi:hypothetical protein
MKSTSLVIGLLTFVCLVLTSCDYDFPLTAKPTHKIDPRLVGDWASTDKEDAKDEVMHVRDFDGSNYAVSMDKDIYRVFHSDFASTAFLSVQDLNATNRKYLYFVWTLSADGNQLSLKAIDSKVISEATKSTGDIQRLIRQQLLNPKLFRDEIKFTRKQSSH